MHLTGYPSLAAFIASDEDKSAAIFKRFDRLAARNLLYLQSELAELQAQQDVFDQEDLHGNSKAKQSCRNFQDFKARAETDSARLDLAKQIRVTMKEYREALLFESTLASIPPPSKHTLRAFICLFYNGSPKDQDSFPTLGGYDADIYDDKDIHDLVALRVPEAQDRLISFVQHHMGWLFSTGTRDGRTAYASGHRIMTFITWVSTILAAILLVGAIVVLYKVQSPDWRLGLIALFTMLFAICVGLLTSARRTELFGATAAYAAVLVVFVSGNLGGPSTPQSG